MLTGVTFMCRSDLAAKSDWGWSSFCEKHPHHFTLAWPSKTMTSRYTINGDIRTAYLSIIIPTLLMSYLIINTKHLVLTHFPPTQSHFARFPFTIRQCTHLWSTPWSMQISAEQQHPKIPIQVSPSQRFWTICPTIVHPQKIGKISLPLSPTHHLLHTITTLHKNHHY